MGKAPSPPHCPSSAGGTAAEWSGGFRSIQGPEKSYMVVLEHQKDWIVLPVVKCQVTAHPDQQEFGIAVERQELDWTAELSFSESNLATLRLPTNNNSGNQTAKSSWSSTSKHPPKRKLLACCKAHHQWGDPTVLRCFIAPGPRECSFPCYMLSQEHLP